MYTAFAVINLLTLVYYVHAILNARQARKVMAWTDLRDVQFARLFQAAWRLTYVPKDNPLSNFKQHGMLSKNAFMAADFLMPALDERLGVLDFGLNGVTREAKALKVWEDQHPCPPRNYWQAWFQRKVEPSTEPHPIEIAQALDKASKEEHQAVLAETTSTQESDS